MKLRGYVCPGCGHGDYSLDPAAPTAEVMHMNSAQVELECDQCGHVWTAVREDEYEQVVEW